MFNSIEEYLDALKKELKDADPALIQDALSDAREHLSLALEAEREKTPDTSVPDRLKVIVEDYGTPEETASAYREVERRTPTPLKQVVKPRSLLGRFFGVYADPRTWGALLFMFISFVTGMIYFTWAVTGLSLSISFLILIIGLPLAILFLVSVQGLALLEGRLVEALLGMRMPRRLLFAQPGLKWLERLKVLVTDKHTWLSLIYLILQMPLGLVYFTFLVTLIAISIALVAGPSYVHLSLAVPNAAVPDYTGYFVPLWKLPWWQSVLMAVGGILGLTLTLHLVRGVGFLHGRYAKWMLVSS